jgi:hypothetical protein
MAAQDNQAICNEISAHINKQAGDKKSWYVGIAANIARRLHGDHQVPEKDHWFIWREAKSAGDARTVEKALHDWGCDGGPGGGDATTKFVYAYLKTSVTKQ